MGFWAIFVKELKELLRAAGLLFFIVYKFTVEIYVAASGINMDAKNIAVGVVDYSPGVVSTKLLSSLRLPEFRTPVFYNSQKELFEDIKNKKIAVGLIFDTDFEKNIALGKESKIELLLDATAASQGYFAYLYLQNIANDTVNKNIKEGSLGVSVHKLFNQNSDSRYYMVLNELMSVVTLLSIILSAAVFVKEKENGTWDLMLLMPVSKITMITAKVLSQSFVIMVGVFVGCGVVVFGVFDTPLNGSFWVFLALTFLFSLSSAGIGLFIAAIAQDIMRVGQLSMMIMMPILFLSGAWTPVYAMHPFLQFLTLFSPLRYYIEGVQSIFFRGAAFVDLLPYFAGVTVLGVVLFIFGTRRIMKLF